MKTIKRTVEEHKEFTKSDLKTGMQVELRNGDRYVVMLDTMAGNNIINVGGQEWGSLDRWDDRLNHGSSSDLDIVRVYGNALTFQYLISKMSDTYIIWERQEDVEELTMEQVCEELGREIKIKKSN